MVYHINQLLKEFKFLLNPKLIVLVLLILVLLVNIPVVNATSVPNCINITGYSRDAGRNVISIHSDGSCCTESVPCTPTDIVDTLGVANSYYSKIQDANLIQFRNPVIIGNGYIEDSGNTVYFEALGWLLQLGDQSSAGYDDGYIMIESEANVSFGNITEDGNPLSGTTFHSYTPDQSPLCQSAAICVEDDSTVNFYDSAFIRFDSYQAAGYQRNNIVASPGAIMDINRLSYSASGSWARDCSTNLPILYVSEDTTMNDYAFYNARYGIEYNGEPDSVFTNLYIHDACSGIRICTYNGSVRGYQAEANVYDIRLGGHNIHLIDSTIDPDATQWDACGGSDTSYGNRFLKQQSSYNIVIKDTSDQGIGDLNITSLDLRGDEEFDVYTYSNGSIDEQILLYRYVHPDSTGIENCQSLYGAGGSSSNCIKYIYTPHTFYLKKYGYKFVKSVVGMTNAANLGQLIEINPYVSKSESAAKTQTGITYTEPTKVEWDDNETETVSSQTITLNNYPIVQSEFFGLYNTSSQKSTFLNGSKIPVSDYVIYWENGTVWFSSSNYNTIGVRAVYYYGGSIQITENHSMQDIYEYMQANRSDVLTTDTGEIYTCYVDIILGNDTSFAGINETSIKTLNFEDGFGFTADEAHGFTRNIESNTWDFYWRGGTENGTFYRKYDYDLEVTDTGGTGLSGVNFTLKNKFGQDVIVNYTNGTGNYGPELLTYATYINTTGSTATTQGPFTLYLKKYTYIFTKSLRAISTKTSDEFQLQDNPFVTLSETAAKALTSINFTEPYMVNFGDEFHTTFLDSGYTVRLDNYPVVQSEFIAVFSDDGSTNTSLGRVTGVPATGQYNISWAEGWDRGPNSPSMDREPPHPDTKSGIVIMPRSVRSLSASPVTATGRPSLFSRRYRMARSVPPCQLPQEYSG